MKELKSKYDLFRQQVHIIIYGTNTVAGRLFDLALLVLILLSVLMVMLETVDKVDQRFHQFLIISEWVITIFFTIEYILRIISIKKPHQYIFSFYGIIDLIAILPMYLSFFVTGTSVLAVVRALRLLRIFRILNLVHFTGQASELKLAIKASRTKIIVFIYFVLVVCILLGSLMYVIEGDASGFTEYSCQYLLVYCHPYHGWLWRYCSHYPLGAGYCVTNYDSGLWNNRGSYWYCNGRIC